MASCAPFLSSLVSLSFLLSLLLPLLCSLTLTSASGFPYVGFSDCTSVVYSPVNDHLFVTDAEQNTVTELTTAGDLYHLYSFQPNPDNPAGSFIDVAIDVVGGDLFLLDNSDIPFVVQLTPVTTTSMAPVFTNIYPQDFTFDNPMGLAHDSLHTGWIYVADTNNNRVVAMSYAMGVGKMQAILTTSSPSLSGPCDVAVDPAGNVYIADCLNDRVVQWTANNKQVTWSYTPPSTPSSIFLDSYGIPFVSTSNSIVEIGATNGVLLQTLTANVASPLSNPLGGTVDSAGNVYVADQGNGRVVQFLGKTGPQWPQWFPGYYDTPTGVVTYDTPTGVVCDWVGNLYVVTAPPGRDFVPSQLFKITITGMLEAPFPIEIPTVSNVFPNPQGLAIGSYLYACDEANQRVIEFNTKSGEVHSSIPTTPVTAPVGIAFDYTNNLWILGSDSAGAVLLIVLAPAQQTAHPVGNILQYPVVGTTATALAVVMTPTYCCGLMNQVYIIIDGSLQKMKSPFGFQSIGQALDLVDPTGLTWDYTGKLFIADTGNMRIVKVDPDGKLLWVFGGGLQKPSYLTLDLSGNLYGTDQGIKQTVFKQANAGPWLYWIPLYWTSEGDVAILVDHRDGLDHRGTMLWMSDERNNTVYQITTAGIILTNFSLPSSSVTPTPKGLAQDSIGNLYVCDEANNRIIRYSTTGVLSIITPTPALRGPNNIAVDSSNHLWVTVQTANLVVSMLTNGTVIASYAVSPASPALNQPSGIAISSSGQVYVADYGNNRVLQLMGTSLVLFYNTSLSGPQGLTTDQWGNVFIADSGNQRVLLVSSAGVLLQEFSGTLLLPTGVAVDSNGTLYVADYGGQLYAAQGATLPSPATASLCLLMYSSPGSLEYPWSVATSLSVLYYPAVQSTLAGSTVTLISGVGTRIFTNRFGVSLSIPMTLAPTGTSNSDNLLYLNSSSPVDQFGLTLNLSTPVQLPGVGPSLLYSFINVYNASGVIEEGGATIFDGLGQAFLSSVPGFVNVTISASNINSLAADYANCRAPITFTNGLRAPTQPSLSNGGLHFSYQYFVSDGVTYSVQGNLTVTTSSAFAASQDQLGNPYQNVTSITGIRIYTYLPTGEQVISHIQGINNNATYFLSDQKWYPYVLLSAAPGVYSMNTAPFLDYYGLEFNILPSAPENGEPPGQGLQYNVANVYWTSSSTGPFLAEGYSTNPPVPSLQKQIYVLLS